MVLDAKRVGAILRALHGRTVCQECADTFAEILDEVRRQGAPERPQRLPEPRSPDS